MVIKDLVENSAMQIKWVPATHMLAAILTKEMPMTDVTQKCQFCVAPDYQRG